MTLTEAMTHARRGKQIRRKDWETSLTLARGVLMWCLPADLLRQCNADGSSDATYIAPPLDRAATDWCAQ